ncbi:hypothetical protein LZ189_23965, partial [Rhodovulum sulfidophilum]|nr:hypothetical protein [Rhodovulum sulfidophilum]
MVGKWPASHGMETAGARRSRVAARQEHLIMNASVIAADQAFGALLKRYVREASPTKRGERWELVRLSRYLSSSSVGISLTLSDLVNERALQRKGNKRCSHYTALTPETVAAQQSTCPLNLRSILFLDRK